MVKSLASYPDLESLPVFAISEVPRAADNGPIWTAELEAIAGRQSTEAGSWFRFSSDPAVRSEGLAIACGWQASVRKWNVRIVALPAANGWFTAAFQFIYAGEDRNLPGGGQRIYWRLPINERTVELYTTELSIISALHSKLLKEDKIAEEIFQETSARCRSFNRQLIDDLGKGRVPSAETLVGRMLRR